MCTKFGLDVNIGSHFIAIFISVQKDRITKRNEEI